ncbi:glycolipid 2-alpha-mannosyltransferase-domain-containing protein [Mycena rosella]|uniref:Glycolipid 2-alpha-mannosyltransferase-domain-containing protein n=1 Tax=Mycena rosella TaxID=1033263 RepID=A0AAD7GCQ6_MYCRO|nr:glycolipid 2-alpha-mannosyltransferase-domain-containing protein [Mycena rosella]
MTQLRYVFLILAVLISLHYILSFTNETYGNATSFTHLSEQFSGSASPHESPDKHYNAGAPPALVDSKKYEAGAPPAPVDNEHHDTGAPSAPDNEHQDAGAPPAPPPVDNKDGGALPPALQYYHSFAAWPQGECGHCYARSEGDLDLNGIFEEFKTRASGLTDSPVQFGLIPHDDWYQPAWIDEARASATRADMINHKVIYGGSVSYRNMCRFNSGFFYRHELLKPFKYYYQPPGTWPP